MTTATKQPDNLALLRDSIDRNVAALAKELRRLDAGGTAGAMESTAAGWHRSLDAIGRENWELRKCLRDTRRCMEGGGTWSDVAEDVDNTLKGSRI